LAYATQVEGSVLQAGDLVRVTAQLVNADGRVLWSGHGAGTLFVVDATKPFSSAADLE
jgi:TolB-like protein